MRRLIISLVLATFGFAMTATLPIIQASPSMVASGTISPDGANGPGLPGPTG